ncbi:MAG TPA: hypothetical protein VGN22_01710 [Pseudonocardia sp.]
MPAASHDGGGATARPRPRPGRPGGRHRRKLTPLTCALDVIGRAGTLVMLTALLVVAATAGALVDGIPAGANATVTATYDRSGP